MDIKNTLVAPDNLIQLGFVRVEDAEWNNIDVPRFEYPQLCFVEKEVRRQAILLILEYLAECGEWDVTLYIQLDVGCGFTKIPFNSDLTIERLNDLHRFSAGKDLPDYQFRNITLD